MDFQTTIFTNKKRTLKSGLVDQGGNLYTELPPGAEMTYESSDPTVCNPTPNVGGVSAKLNSGEVGTATITVTPGGTLDPADPKWAPRTGEVTIVHSEPAGFALSVGDEEAEEEPVPET